MESAPRRARTGHDRLPARRQDGALSPRARGRNAAGTGRGARDRPGRRRRPLRRRRERGDRRRVPAHPARSSAASTGDRADLERPARVAALISPRPPDRRLLLVDADAFYVAVARLVDPEGAGKARLLIVGGSPERRGVVTSASYDARAYGVHSAMPMARAVRLCPGATVVPVPWEACAGKSREIRDVLGRFTPAVEQASSDEFYLDLTGTEKLYGGEPLAATAGRIRAAVSEATSLSVSIGGGTSKLVAKLAAGRAKPRPGAAAPSDGVCIVAPGAEAEFLLQFALADLPGVGPKAQARRSEEHTSELQSQSNLVCRLLLEKKKKKKVQCTQSDRGD